MVANQINILTISTLYDKGGAAYIAHNLHKGFKEAGYNTKFLVGYGKNGFAGKTNDPDIIFSKYRFNFYPHLNFILHKIIGKDYFSPMSNQIIDVIKWADVVICHTLHSHFINFEMFFGLLRDYGSNKKIIMVAHDSWHYTGRCAIISSCQNWKNSCLKCPFPENYPSSFFSITNSEWHKKIKNISSINNLILVSPSESLRKDLKTVYATKQVCLIRNGIDIKPYIGLKIAITKDIEFCISSVNLQQEGKVNLILAEKLLDHGFKIHFIGENNPFSSHPNAIDHGYISSKKKYLTILGNVNCYLFSSSIDIYPTVLVDAICAGNYIFYTKSKGADEIMNAENNWEGSCINSLDEILSVLESHRFQQFITNKSLREEKRNSAISFFNKTRMIEQYAKLINFS